MYSVTCDIHTWTLPACHEPLGSRQNFLIGYVSAGPYFSKKQFSKAKMTSYVMKSS
jgi:hypothetical protein